MKALFITICTAHGLLHLIGFLKGIRLKDFPQIKSHISGIAGVFWFFAHLIIMATVMLYFSAKPYWWIPGIAGAILSQILIITIWRDAKWGSIMNAILLTGCIIGYGKMNFDESYEKSILAFYHEARIPGEKGLGLSDIQHLPYPVKTWLMGSGILNKDKLVTCRLKQIGEIKLSSENENWINFVAEQYFTIKEPGFIWKLASNYAGIVPITGIDYFIDGKGVTDINLLYHKNMVDETGPKIDEGSLQRYLGEIIWFPSAAVSPLIKWTAIDTLNAKATLEYMGTKAEGIFTFNTKGEFVKYSAKRFKDNKNGSERFPWEVESLQQSTMNGVKIPVKLQVTWKLPEGDFTWFRMEISEIDYNLPYRY